MPDFLAVKGVAWEYKSEASSYDSQGFFLLKTTDMESTIGRKDGPSKAEEIKTKPNTEVRNNNLLKIFLGF